MTFRIRVGLILGVSLLAAVVISVLPPIPQDPHYHHFADTAKLLGIPNFWNVVSNLPFLAVGVLGFSTAGASPGKLPELKIQYMAFFVGVFLTGLGSAYYHWNPDNQTLVWDRLPMTVSFMAFLSIVIGEHVDTRLSRELLWPLLGSGIASVLYWYWTESRGGGDLRPYAIVQFLPMLIIPLMLLALPSRFSSTRYLWLVLLAYSVSKILELADQGIFGLTGFIGGHPLKHMAAAVGTYFFYLALQWRELRSSPPRHPLFQRRCTF